MYSENNNYYLAGLIDGEGSITLMSRKSKTGNVMFKSPCISVSSTTIPIIDFLKTNYGGHSCFHKAKQSHHKDAYSWRVSYTPAVELCKIIYPLLLEPSKIYRAKLIAEKYESVTSRNGKYSSDLLEAKLQFQTDFYLK